MRPTLHLALCVSSALCASSLYAQNLSVTQVDPARHRTDASTAAVITVNFDAPLDAASVSSSSVMVWGRWSGVVPGARSVSGSTLRFQPARPFFPGETVSVAMTSALRSTSGGVLVGGHSFSFWVRSAPGSTNFKLDQIKDIRFPGEGLIQSYGAYAGDLNGDGAIDLSIPNEVAADVRVMLGDGCGDYSTPTSYPLPPGSFPSSNEGADFDGDGDVDMATANIMGDTMGVFLGDGAGAYAAPLVHPTGNQPRGLTTLDLEGDGDMDIAVASRSSSDVALHVNGGAANFAPATFFEGGGSAETSLAAADINNDGWTDLFVGHFNSQRITVRLSNGDGSFSAGGSASVGGPPWMLASGDIDLDGFVDAASCGSFGDTASWVKGDGAGGLVGTTTFPVANFVLAVDLGDLEGDGDLDLVVSSYSDDLFAVLPNDGSGGFPLQLNLPASGAGSCAILADYDRDGDIDILGIDEVTDELFIYEQTNLPLAGVQRSACSASLRIDELGGLAGYGGKAGHPLQVGSTHFVGISGPAGEAWVLGLGAPLEPGLSLGGSGLLNVFPAQVLASGALDGFGEATYTLPVPGSVGVGATVAFQGFVTDAGSAFGGRLTNPESGLTQL